MAAVLQTLMMRLFAGSTVADYLQVHLVDRRGLDSIPGWPTGQEACVFGRAGVGVATSDWGPVRLEVWADEPQGQPDCEGGITVTDGLEVGSIAGGDTHLIDFPRGHARVAVFVDRENERVTGVRFYLWRGGSQPA